MDGIILVDKPKWKTSFNMVSLMRRITGEKRIGHIGTLDPFATGLLVLALGKAARLVEYLQGLPKVYHATLYLGKVSTSYDPEGTITESGDPTTVTLDDITKVLRSFEGDIEQIPPIFSAIKIDGKRAYKSARKGKLIEMPVRKIHISHIKILSWEMPYLSIEVACSSGTYIRSLGNDIGKALGVGAYLKDLRRTSIDKFCLDEKNPILDMTRQYVDSAIIPLREIKLDIPSVVISNEVEDGLVYGVQPEIKSTLSEGTTLQLKNQEDELLAIGTVKEGIVKLSKVFL